MNGFEMLESDKLVMFDNGLFSTDCILYSPDGKTQGLGATLAKDNPDYNSEDRIKCFCPYIGIDVNTDTGLGIFADRAEITINISSVKIGTIEKGWLIDVYFPSLKKWIKFKCEHAAIDRMIGTYLIRPTLVEKKIQNVSNASKLRIGGLGENNI